jgi:hypothetical protein
MPLAPDFKDKLLAALSKRGINPLCECCGKNDWTVIDQAVSVQITDLSGNLRIPAPQVPSAGLVCNNCGNIRLFALGVLNLLPKEEDKK